MNEIIKQTFQRCWGLQSALKDGLEKQDTLLLRGSIESLSYQSGIRISYIEDNIKEIIKL